MKGRNEKEESSRVTGDDEVKRGRQTHISLISEW